MSVPSVERRDSRPASFAELCHVVADGILIETHHVEFKAGLPSPSRAVNLGAAKDMASLSIDGGRLFYGIAESDGSSSVQPIPTTGLRERLDQIARVACEPPLHVLTSVYEDPADPTRGVVVVDVPASADAPHMVDGRYWARGDVTTHRLSDVEVARLHAVRSASAITAEAVIEAEISDDPLIHEGLVPGRLYVVARPLAAPADLLTDHLLTVEFAELVRHTSNVAGLGSAPTWDYLERSPRPRAHGVGFDCHETVGRRYRPQLSDRGVTTAMIDLEVHDNGTVRLWATGFTETVPNGWTGVDVESVDEATAVRLVRDVVEVLANLARLTGYGGKWSIVVGLVDIRDRVSSQVARGPNLLTRYTADRYIRSRSLVSAEALDDPGQVVDSLMLPLKRALGVSAAQGY